MRFNPIYFINLCEQSGFTLSRKADLICYSYENKQMACADFFIDAMRQHKAELLPFLIETRDAIQTDLFSG